MGARFGSRPSATVSATAMPSCRRSASWLSSSRSFSSIPRSCGGAVDERTRQAGLILSGALAVGFAAALLARWSEPFRISLEPDALVATPLIGSTARIPYDRIVRVGERPPTFLRGHVELDIRAAGRRRPLYIRGSISDYTRLTRLLRNRVPPAVRSEWQEAKRA